MDSKKSRFLCVAWLGLIAALLPAQKSSALDNMLLSDGESTTTYVYGIADNEKTHVFRGGYCFQGTPDASHPAGIKLTGLTSYRKDISQYDEIWFYAKTDLPDLKPIIDFYIYGSQNYSNTVSTTAGQITGEYQLIRIPIASLKTTACPLTSIDILYFGKAKPTTTHKIFIDDVWAVKLGSVNGDTAPMVKGNDPIAFGEVAVSSAATKSVTIENAGNGPLVVSNITVAGAQAGEFAVLTAPFTLDPEKTATINVKFSPTVPAIDAATVVLTHTTTLMGNTTSIALTGKGVAPLLQLPAKSLDFGKAQEGTTVSWPFAIQNKGNQDLVISNPTAPQYFAVTPNTLTVPPDGAGQFTVSFSPGALGSVPDTSSFTFASNDPLHANTTIPLRAEGIAAAAGTTPLLNVRVQQITSSTVTLAWPIFSGAESVFVYLAPEPEGMRNEPLYKKQVAQQSGTSTGCTIDKLAAATDAFFEVEALKGAQVIASGFVHARTVGGPRAALDTPVRNVHLMGPKILEIVMLDLKVTSYTSDTGTLIDYHGPEYQSAQWTVTRADDKTTIPVSKVYRHSVPAGQNYYEVGYGTNTHDELMDVEHRMYLMLDAPVGNREILTVKCGDNLTFMIPYSDHYLETPAIQLNQVGYSPRAKQRWAYVSGWLGDGGTLLMDDFPNKASVLKDTNSYDAKDREPAVSDLGVAERSANDVGAGGRVLDINLATVPPSEGTVYRVLLPGIGVSWPTQVSETAVFKTFFTVARGMFHQRWGRDLDKQWTEWEDRDPDHDTVYFTQDPNLTEGNYSKMPAEFLNQMAQFTPHSGFKGGHHDAADFDMRMTHTLVGLYLLRLYEANPGVFLDNQLIIPESGNGIPDILDEAEWSMRLWANLQDLEWGQDGTITGDGGVRTGVESTRHPFGRYFADQDTLTYWTYAKDPIHTARCAAEFAQIARLLQPFIDPNKSDDDTLRLRKYATRAVYAYNYALQNGVTEDTQGPLLYAAGELYHLTGESQYKEKFEATWKANCSKWDPNSISLYPYFPWASSWTETSKLVTLGDHVMGYLTSTSPLAGYLAFAKERFAEQADEVVATISTVSAHRNGRLATSSPSWGQATAVGHWINPTYHALQLGGLPEEKKQAYFDAISLSADYVLGGNPNGMVWITELGSRHPENPDHNDALSFAQTGKGLIPGIPVYGPTTTVPGTTHYRYMTNVFYPPFTDQPLLRRYCDTWSFISNSEFTVTETMAPDVELFGMLLAPGMMPPESWRPFKPEHRNTLAPRDPVIPANGNPTPDTTPPNPGKLTAAAPYSKTAPLVVSYSDASDAGGLKNVRLWVKVGEGGTWQDTGKTATTASGTFEYQPSGDNKYFFFLQAEDNAGNVSPAPTGGGK